MNLTYHIFKKDTRGFREVLVIWTVLNALPILVMYRLMNMPGSMSIEVPSDLGFAMAGILSSIATIASYVVAGAAVLADTPASSAAFWPTRPISGGRLLSAKALWIAVWMFGMPALLWTAWGLYCHYSPSSYLLTYSRMIIFASASILPAAAIASFSQDSGRFTLFTSVAVAAYITVGLVSLSHQAEQNYFDPREHPINLLLIASVAVVVGAVATQYLSRRTVLFRVLVIFALGLLLSQEVWGTRTLKDSAIYPSTPDGDKVEVSVGTTTLAQSKGGTYRIDIQIPVKGVPPDEALGIGAAEIDLTLPDGRHIADPDATLRTGAYPAMNPAYKSVQFATNIPVADESRDPETRAKIKSMRKNPFKVVTAENYTLNAEAGPMFAYVASMVVTREDARALFSGKCTVAATIHVNLDRPHVLATLPLSRTGAATAPGLRINVLYAAREEEPAMGGSTTHVWRAVFGYDTGPQDDVDFFPFDYRGVHLGLTRSPSAIRSMTKSTPGTFGIVRQTYLTIPMGKLWRTDHWEDDPEWPASLGVAAVRFEHTGATVRKITVEGFHASADRNVLETLGLWTAPAAPKPKRS